MGKKLFKHTILFLGLLSALKIFSSSVPPEKGVAFPSPELLRLDPGKDASAWNSGFTAVYQTLLKNLHLPSGFFKTRYAYPSPIFRGVYLWDSAFIAQVWKPWDVKTAEDVLKAVLDNAAPDGRLKHFVSPYDKSGYTQPPVIAWSVWELYQWSKDKEFLAYAYPILKNYQLWLSANRGFENGLYFWAHSYESGIDNSPRFSSADEKIKRDLSSIAPVDINSYVYSQNLLLAKMAEVLGKTQEAQAFQKNADTLARLINEKLWDPETGLYYDRDLKTDQLLKIKTIASLLPLFAGIPDQDQAKKLRDHIMNPGEFNTYFPLPSVSRDDPSFEKDCWRGPVWINTAYMVLKGLKNYGYDAEASELAYRIVERVYANYQLTGKLVEFYDPDQDGFKDLHRKRGNLYKLITLGDKPQANFVGWTGLVNTLLIEELVGFKKQEDKRILAPEFPTLAKGLSLKLTIPSENLTIEIQVLDDASARGKIISENKPREFLVSPGTKIEF